VSRRCWCNRPAKGACGCHCANHDVAPPAFQVFGVNVPASVARTADDGVTVFEPSGRPVMRWRTETAKRVTRPAADGGPSVTEYLRSKGEIA
jgi:hypothetical protein